MADPATTHAINDAGFVNLLIAAKTEGIRRLVYASSSSVYGDNADIPKREENTGNPLSPYAASKKSNEMYAGVFASAFGMELIGLRYFNVFGPRQDPNGPYAAVIPAFLRLISEGESPVIYGDGSQTRDFTFVENVIQANIKAMFVSMPGALNQVYNVACGEACSVGALYSLIASLPKFNLPNQLKTPAPKFEAARKGDILHSVADISRATQLLGYQNSIRLKEGLEKMTE
jgi:UDP-N-acetylglucosamine 4-epimerase